MGIKIKRVKKMVSALESLYPSERVFSVDFLVNNFLHPGLIKSMSSKQLYDVVYLIDRVQQLVVSEYSSKNK